MNGYIWVQKHAADHQQTGEEGFDSEAVYSNVNDVSLETSPMLCYRELMSNRTLIGSHGQQ